MRGMESASRSAFVKSLSPLQRHVLSMTYVDRLTPPEIALVLGLTPRSVADVLMTIRRQARNAFGLSGYATASCERAQDVSTSHRAAKAH